MAKLPITRLPGESHEDWTRRHSREKQRIYRADKPKSTRVRGPNKIPTPFHAEFPQMDGESSVDWKRRLGRIKVQRQRAANPEKMAARRRELYVLNDGNDQKKAWREANPEKVKKYARDHFDRNREEKLAALKEWNTANPDRMREVKREWFSKNRGVMNAANGRYRARAELATPVWADWKEIEKFYNLARKLTRQTGIPHQVDHVIPLRGKTVSGLHVHHNLQVITKAANIEKRNYLIEV